MTSQFARALGVLGAVVMAAVVVGCGGGGSGGGGGSPAPVTPANQVAINVAQGTGGVANIPTVSVTVCPPGSTAHCQTIDNIQVDTMSYGLRIVNTAAAGVLPNLAPETDGSGNQIAECTQFADGYTWGSVRRADLTIGSKTAGNVPVAIIGDMSSSSVPSNCAATGTAENTVALFGANGVLGIGVAPYDCESCATSIPTNPPYYICPGGANCTATTIALVDQVTNPVVKFASDNNGVVLTMPAIGANGATSASGTMTFGIGTQANNVLTGATTFGTNSAGLVNSTFGTTSGAAFFDSGSNGYFFQDATLAACSGIYAAFYCPSSLTSRNVTVSNMSGAAATATVAMSIQNGQTLLTSGNFAFNDLAGDLGLSGVVDVGMPFFYGRTVYFGYDLTQLGRTQTPYVAF
ncbi:DUF3443 domain-containing protein [Trinickia sp. LjRoot230]|uniref:DUF3443 domain-containing protein n=1 Tax=Trinickia sp. LjRoot230 TaxID=3342288 RepID=UPI003ECE1E35